MGEKLSLSSGLSDSESSEDMCYIEVLPQWLRAKPYFLAARTSVMVQAWETVALVEQSTCT